MATKVESNFKYLVSSGKDLLWGITVDNVGSADIPPGYDVYPPRIGHPEDYYFHPDKGRILSNYQLIYISSGQGICYLQPDEPLKIESGNMLIIPPYTWHSYSPDRKTGWHEYWIGMRGDTIEKRFHNGFISPSQKVFKIGFREEIIEYYRHAQNIAMEEKPGYQQVLSGLANMIFSLALYYDANRSLISDRNVQLVEQARTILRENYLTNITPQQVAERMNTGYSLLRKIFKEYTDISLLQYLIELKLQTARTLLINSSKSIKEIAFYLNYEDALYFSTLFKKHVGCSPSEFRKMYSTTGE
ncbi:AraC family transcriptional regulator [Parabacteroides pacaensis]|uniref:AraC family transcriptional regulator n=1 Tax=Parabacteroides pacaensis TaxID=2086575 RepID=UPI000D10D345|nr:AraC family transcriptional regulator [Parabacteroides pacaensis]